MPARARGCESLPRSDHTVGVRGGRDGRTFAPEGGAPCIYPGRRASRTVNGFRRSWKFEYECLRPTPRICQTVWHTGVVRTTLELDDALLASLMARLPGVSKTEAIQRAVRFYLTHDAVDQLRQLAGTVEIDDLSRELRGADRTM